MGLVPRMVLVTRPTDYELLLARHGTRGQAGFFLAGRGQSLDDIEVQHKRFSNALKSVQAAVPPHWRATRLERNDLDRFLFEPEDVVVALGQDGLVANLSKYLDGQIVIGLNPMPDRYDGVLVRHRPRDACELLQTAAAGSAATDARTMALARLDDGQKLYCLNEVFVGHASHQSARYRIEYGSDTEHQSSSGLIVTTGTGATGWARSIHRCINSALELPAPDERRLAYFVREPWPSIASGTDLTEGWVDAQHPLEIVSEMDERGVIFGDGIESDHLEFGYGRRLRVMPAERTLNLLAG